MIQTVSGLLKAAGLRGEEEKIEVLVCCCLSGGSFTDNCFIFFQQCTVHAYFVFDMFSCSVWSCFAANSTVTHLSEGILTCFQICVHLSFLYASSPQVAFWDLLCTFNLPSTLILMLEFFIKKCFVQNMKGMDPLKIWTSC